MSLGGLLGRQTVAYLARKAREEPLAALYGTGERIGWLAMRLLPVKRRIALENLRLAFPDWEEARRRQTAAGVFRHFALNMMEFLKLPYLGDQELEELVELRGEQHLRAALAEGGVIYYTGHFGNWELMGARLTAAGYPLCVIARDLHDPMLSNLVARHRAHVKMTVLEGKSAPRLSLAALRQGKLLGILNDQDAGRDAPFVSFFGRPAATAPGPVVLAARCGVKLVPAFCVRQPDNRHIAHILEPIQFTRAELQQNGPEPSLRRLNALLEKWIVQYPEQWLWLHKRWKSRPDGKRERQRNIETQKWEEREKA